MVSLPPAASRGQAASPRRARVMLAALLCLAHAHAAVPAHALSIEGTVVDGRGAPVAGLHVSLSGPVQAQAVTDRRGSYAFANLPRGAYEVAITAEGRTVLPAERRRAVLGDGPGLMICFAAPSDPLTAIWEIQGRAHLSPYRGEEVTGVPGIVTAMRGPRSFYLQDPLPDADEGTSEGLLVTVTRMPAIGPGDLVLVDGRVQEFYGGGRDAGDLSVTQLRASSVRLLLRGMELPSPVVLGEGGRIPPDRVICDDAAGNIEESTYDPQNDGADFYESLEGMLVQVNDAVVVGSVHTAYGEFQVVGDGGRHASTPTARGGLALAPGDYNPERITVDLRGEPDVAPQTILPLVVGDRFSGPIVGPLDYSYSDYKILPWAALPAPIPANLPRQIARDRREEDVLSVGFLNLQNFSVAGPQEKIRDIAETIATALHCPDLMALAEVQDDSGARDDGTTSARLTYEALLQEIRRAGGPATYQVCEVEPRDNSDGGEPGGNIRVALLYDSQRVTLSSRPEASTGTEAVVGQGAWGPLVSPNPGLVAPGDQAFVDSRKPLAVELEFRGRPLYVLVCHFASKSGDAQLFSRSHPLVFRTERVRTQQAHRVHEFVARILALDPQARVIVVGDLNEFAFAPPLLELKGDILVDLAEELLPPQERYSYVYRGNSQDLDHVLVSRALLEGTSPGFQIPHRYAEYLYDTRWTDHDPLLATFRLP